MSRPVNLYIISRIHDENSFHIAESHESLKNYEHETRYQEIESLRMLVDELMDNGVRVPEFDGFYYGFTIPGIGKEFDLLKFNSRSCLNIELKSEPVPEQQILSQLLRNRYYLSHLGVRLDLMTAVTGSMECFLLTAEGILQRITVREAARIVRRHKASYRSHAEDLFRASEYLVSPMATPGKFLRGEYFLTQAQEQVKRSLLKAVSGVSGGAFFHITGKPGTGKTLLLYDIARTLAPDGGTVVVRGGTFTRTEQEISLQLDGLDIVSADAMLGESLQSAARFVLVDEAQRLTLTQFEQICRCAEQSGKICIFSTDPDQVLTTSEKARDIAGLIRAIPPDGEYELSEKIRMNREMSGFLAALRDLSAKNAQPGNSFANVQVSYANTTAEAQELIAYFRSKGYVFINYAGVEYSTSPFLEMEEAFDPRCVIGMEFDRVVMLMDSSFYYDDTGRLQGVPAPDPDLLYPNLFYQGITRVREKLAVVIMKAPELFEKVISIFQ